MSVPLSGVKAVDITTVVMGLYATRILGDLGAEIIMIADGVTRVPEDWPRRQAGRSVTAA